VPAHPIQVHVNTSVDTVKEKDMLRHFEQDFKPAAVKFPGWIDVKIGLPLTSTRRSGA
jgi:hypothetical protein